MGSLAATQSLDGDSKTSVDICSRCIIDDGVPGVRFDENGECNYCKIHDALDRAHPTGDEGKAYLDELFADIKRRGRRRRYDCVVGVSGGVDSTYLLYHAKSAGLRPLAVHFDSGWDSEIAVTNIRKSISLLGVDLQTYVVDWEEFKDILRSHLYASIPWADMPTDIGLVASLYRIAAQEGVSAIFVGSNFRAEGKQPTEWTYGDSKMIRAIQRRFGTKPLKSFPNLPPFTTVMNAFVRRIKMIRPLCYMDYSKQDARQLLEERFGWKDYGGHHYESIFTRFVHSYYLRTKFGIDKRKITLSAQV
jgi:N-acetyl sugar amidotransferase